MSLIRRLDELLSLARKCGAADAQFDLGGPAEYSETAWREFTKSRSEFLFELEDELGYNPFEE